METETFQQQQHQQHGVTAWRSGIDDTIKKLLLKGTVEKRALAFQSYQLFSGATLTALNITYNIQCP